MSKPTSWDLANASRSARVFEEFKERLRVFNAECLEPKWLGAQARHRVRCVRSHEGLTVRPNNLQSGAQTVLCRECQKVELLIEFSEAVASYASQCLETEWLGTDTPHRVHCNRCDRVVSPRPNSVKSGSDPCKYCAKPAPDKDVFYVVTDREFREVKLGITHGDARRRLVAHASERGMVFTALLIEDMPEGAAEELERSVLAALKDAGHLPTRGREQFHSSVMPTIREAVKSFLDASDLS